MPWVSTRLFRGLVALMLALGAAVMFAPASGAATTNPAFDQRMLLLVNQARSANGLPYVEVATGLTNLSAWWSGQEAAGATGGQLMHNPDAWTQTLSYGASNRSTWGENVAKWTPTSTTADAVFNAYMASPGHRANILGAKYRYIGVATVIDTSGVSWNTMTFTDTVEPGQAVPTASTGTVKAVDAGSGAAVPGMVVQIRNGACSTTFSTMTTNTTGSFPVTAYPGVYCAAALSVPSGYKVPAPQTFTVPAWSTFAVTLSVAGGGPVTGQVLARSAAGVAIPGVVFQIRNSACSTVFSTMVTGSTGAVSVTANPNSVYCAAATSVPSGYLVPAPQQFTTGTTGWTATVTVPNVPVPVAGQVLAKSGSGAAIPGVVFQIRNSACTTVFSTMVTGSTGGIPVTAYPDSTYCAVATSVPSGYAMPAPQVFTTGKAGWTATVTIPAAAPSVVVGELRAVDSVTGARLPGVTVAIRNASCGTTFSTMLTGATGAFTITAGPGTYCAVPLAVPAGYLLPASVTFDTGWSAFAVTVRVTPKPQPVSGTLTMVDASGLTIPGAVVAIMNGSCSTTFSTMSTDADGAFPIVAMPGSYCATTLSVPEGYLVPEAVLFSVEQTETFAVTLTA